MLNNIEVYSRTKVLQQRRNRPTLKYKVGCNWRILHGTRKLHEKIVHRNIILNKLVKNISMTECLEKSRQTRVGNTYDDKATMLESRIKAELTSGTVTCVCGRI